MENIKNDKNKKAKMNNEYSKKKIPNNNKKYHKIIQKELYKNDQNTLNYNVLLNKLLLNLHEDRIQITKQLNNIENKLNIVEKKQQKMNKYINKIKNQVDDINDELDNIDIDISYDIDENGNIVNTDVTDQNKKTDENDKSITDNKKSISNLSNNLKNYLTFDHNTFNLDPIINILTQHKYNKQNTKNNENINENEEIINEIDENIKIENLNFDIKTIDDLLEMDKLYTNLIADSKQNVKMKYNNGLYEMNGKMYSINLEIIHKLSVPLLKLKNMVGIQKIKDNILDMILYYLQGFENKNNTMLHTIIEGPPGVGKTNLGIIIGEIYSALGIIEGGKFKIVKRTDLIGEYLGHTAQKTQRLIDEADGGILFIDEAYSLGSPDSKDSFSKECVDTLNQNLSENKKKFICIIAGYPDELDKCFFSQNQGLIRRFPFRYRIDSYNETEMKDIFLNKIKECKWKFDFNDTTKTQIDYMTNFFKHYKEYFNNYGGDIDNFITICKFIHSRRIITEHPKYRRILNKEDIIKGFDKYLKNKKENKNEYNCYIYS